LMNAFGMVAPVYALEQWLSRAMDVTSETPVLAVLFMAGFGIAPLLVIGGAAAATYSLAGDSSSLRRTRGVGHIAVSYAYALVPFGFGMWLAHYSFHLLTGALTVIPVLQNTVIDVFGWPVLDGPYWRWAGMRPGAVYPIQLGFILLGTLGSLTLIYRISERDYPDRTGVTAAPWAIVTVALAVVAVWILAQPMEMRGLGLAG
jgi:hypothetical protein